VHDLLCIPSAYRELTLNRAKNEAAVTEQRQSIQPKLDSFSKWVFEIRDEIFPATSARRNGLSTDLSPTFTLHQLEEELDQSSESAEPVRNVRIICQWQDCPVSVRSGAHPLGWGFVAIVKIPIMRTAGVQWYGSFTSLLRCRNSSNSQVTGDTLESLLLEEMTPETSWHWEIVLFKAETRVWVRLSNVQSNRESTCKRTDIPANLSLSELDELESISQQLATSYARTEVAVGLKKIAVRGGTKLETLGNISEQSVSVLRAKSLVSLLGPLRSTLGL